RRIEHFGSVRGADDEDEWLVGDGPANETEPAKDLVAPAVLDQVRERVHLVEQGVQPLAATHHHAAHHHAAAALTTAVHADGIDLVHEHDAGAALTIGGVLPAEPAGVPAELTDHHLGHAPEHAADGAGVDVDERQSGLGGEHRSEERLSLSGGGAGG